MSVLSGILFHKPRHQNRSLWSSESQLRVGSRFSLPLLCSLQLQCLSSSRSFETRLTIGTGRVGTAIPNFFRPSRYHSLTGSWKRSDRARPVTSLACVPELWPETNKTCFKSYSKIAAQNFENKIKFNNGSCCFGKTLPEVLSFNFYNLLTYNKPSLSKKFPFQNLAWAIFREQEQQWK